MAQMCGATAIKYYLPTVFIALGLSKDLSLMASGIESTLKIGLTIMEMFIIDKIGRRNSLLIGAVVMAVAMVVCYVSAKVDWQLTVRQVNGALPLAYPHNSNHASDYACIVFIFFFSFGYSVGFGPNAWVYGTEVFSLSLLLPTRTNISRSSPPKSAPRESVSAPAPVPSAPLS